MWVLLLMIVTASGDVAVYDQGIYNTMDECLEMKQAAINTDFSGHDNIQLTCVRWESEKTNLPGISR